VGCRAAGRRLAGDTFGRRGKTTPLGRCQHPHPGQHTGLAGIAHRPVADFVRSRGVAARSGQNSHEFCYTECARLRGWCAMRPCQGRVIFGSNLPCRMIASIFFIAPHILNFHPSTVSIGRHKAGIKSREPKLKKKFISPVPRGTVPRRGSHPINRYSEPRHYEDKDFIKSLASA